MISELGRVVRRTQMLVCNGVLSKWRGRKYECHGAQLAEVFPEREECPLSGRLD